MKKKIVILDDNLDFSGFKHDNDGYWNKKNVGKPVVIDGNSITMKGVDRNLIGVSDRGDTKLMWPGRDYVFEGNEVLELPADGGLIDFDTMNRRRQYEKDLAVIDNYFKRNGVEDGGNLRKYQPGGPVYDQHPQDNTRVNNLHFIPMRLNPETKEAISNFKAKKYDALPSDNKEQFIKNRIKYKDVYDKSEDDFQFLVDWFMNPETQEKYKENADETGYVIAEDNLDEHFKNKFSRIGYPVVIPKSGYSEIYEKPAKYVNDYGVSYSGIIPGYGNSFATEIFPGNFKGDDPGSEDGTAIHEFAHLFNTNKEGYDDSPLLMKIDNITQEEEGINYRNLDPEKEGYRYKPSEIYSRMMQFRKAMGLKPGEKVTEKFLRKNWNMLHWYFRKGFKPKTLLRYFNEVAQNNYDDYSSSIA